MQYNITVRTVARETFAACLATLLTWPEATLCHRLFVVKNVPKLTQVQETLLDLLRLKGWDVAVHFEPLILSSIPLLRMFERFMYAKIPFFIMDDDCLLTYGNAKEAVRIAKSEGHDSVTILKDHAEKGITQDIIDDNEKRLLMDPFCTFMLPSIWQLVKREDIENLKQLGMISEFQYLSSVWRLRKVNHALLTHVRAPHLWSNSAQSTWGGLPWEEWDKNINFVYWSESVDEAFAKSLQLEERYDLNLR